MKNILRRTKFFSTWRISQRYLSVSLTDLRACVGFCTSIPQQGVEYQSWCLKSKLWRGISINSSWRIY
jgi:hypothetical protein